MTRTTLLLLFLTTACHGRPADRPADDQPAVVQVAGEGFSARELAALSPAATGSDAARFRQEVARTMVLYQMGREDHLDQDPMVRWRLYQMVAQKVAARVSEGAKQTPVSEAEVGDFCRRRKPACEQPAMVKVSQLVLDSKSDAERLLQTELRGRPTAAAFEQAVQKHSTDPISRARGGNLGMLSERGTPYDPHLVAAALALKQDGDLSAPVNVAGKWAILMRTGGTEGRALDRRVIERLAQSEILAERGRKLLDERVAAWRSSNRVEVTE